MNEGVFRILFAVIFFTCIGISGYFRKKADRDSGEKIPRSVDGKIISLFIKIGGFVLWLFPFLYIIHPSLMHWFKIGLPEVARWGGIAAGFITIVLIFWMFKSIGSGISPTSLTRKKHKLITSGPYRWIRHPLYTFGTLLFLSLGTISDSWIIIVLGIFTFILMAIRTPKEEASLIEKFGDDYLKYIKKTGRFLPFIGRR